MHDHTAVILRRLGALLATVVIAAILAAPAAAAPSETTPSGSGVVEETRFARVEISSVSPDIVSTSSPSSVTVTGVVHNIGDRPVRSLAARLERGARVETADALRTSLAADPMPLATSGRFEPLAEEMAPGESTEFTLTMPLSGAQSLQISETGVYPINVNVNGIPEYGGMARIADSATLLPVLSLPPDADRAASYVDPGSLPSGTARTDLARDGSVSANLSSPSSLTLLWPLAASPQLAPGILGGGSEPVRLISEDMARSLSPGGRLHDVLGALGPVADATEPGPLQQSLCLAIDPDLLVTVRAMSLGYVVTDDPADPTASTTPGIGADAAAQWLAELRRVAAKTCVVATPFAQADLNSLARVDDDGLTRAALNNPADIVDTILEVDSVRGLAVPAIGAVDRAGSEQLAAAGITKAATSAGSVDPAGASDPGPTGRFRIGDLRVQTVDAPISATLGGLGPAPISPVLEPQDQEVPFTDESQVSRRQAAVAALAFPALNAPRPTDSPADSAVDSSAGAAAALPTTGRSQFVVPPAYWGPDTDDAAALLSMANLLLESGAATPAPLAEVVEGLEGADADARLRTAPGTSALTTGSWLMSRAQAATVAEHSTLSWQLQTSLMRSADVNATPENYVAPLREDLLRAMRSPGRSDAPRLAEIRTARVEAVAATLDRMVAAVAILDPGGRYTLASERSPLLLVVRNDLALPIRVHLETSAPDDIDVGDIGTIEIPARGTRQIQLPTRAESSEATTVSIALESSTDVPLGEPITLSIHSNAYGKPLFYITIAAGVGLVLLVARRLWHRFRGEPDPADEDRPEPDEQERILAASTYQHRLDADEYYRREGHVHPDPDDPDRGEQNGRSS